MDGFSETHIIGKDSVDSTFVKGDHPVKSDELVVLKLSALQHGRLALETGKALLFNNFFVIGLEVTSFSAFMIGKGFFGIVLGEEVICIKFCLLYEGLDSLRSGGIFRGFELLEFEKDFFFDSTRFLEFLGFLLTHEMFINEANSWRHLWEG